MKQYTNKTATMNKKTINKTLITSIDEIKEGDVLLCIWRKGMERNKKSSNPLPEINYRHIMRVVSFRLLEDGTKVFNHACPTNLSSDNGDHKVVQSVIGFNAYKNNPKTACTTSTFGCNHGMEGYEIWRLDNVVSKPDTHRPMPNLKGNPSFDLMM